MGEAQEARFPDTGEVFEGKYKIDSLLGTGGYAKVYKATQTDLGRDVAIKILSPVVQNVEASQSNSGSVESLAIRFEREAKLVSRLRSPYTITMYDYGRTDDDLLYMVLEYVDGITLTDAEAPMEPRRVAKILKQVLKSLHEAHDEGLLHRDLKPANIMIFEHLGEPDQVKLLDFGIAKLIGERHKDRNKNEQDLTGDATLLGTPRYMAPEQIRGNDVGPSRDIYSLGLIAYEMMVGEKAITEDDSIKIMAKHISADPIQIPPEEDPDPELSKIINKMLAKDVDERYDNVQEVVEELKRYERGMEVDGLEPAVSTPTPAASGSGSTTGGGSYDPVDVEPIDEAQSDGSTKLVLAGVAALVLVSGVVIVLAVAGVFTNNGKTETISSQKSGSTAPSAHGPEKDEAVEEKVATSEEDAGGASDKPKITRITTSPKGAKIWIGDEERGETPLDVEIEKLSFPTTVKVELDGETKEREVSEPSELIAFEFETDEDEESDESAPEKTGGSDDETGGRGGARAETTHGSSGSTGSHGGSSDDSDQSATGAAPSHTGGSGSSGSDDSPSTGGGSDDGAGSPDDDSDEESGGSDDGPEFLPLE